MLKTGHKTLISLGGVNFEEIEVTPPGVNGGGKIDTTTQRNDEWRTAVPKELKDLDDMNVTVAYDASKLGTIYDLCNVNQLITVTFPDGSTMAFWGFLNTFKPTGLTSDNRPQASAVFAVTNSNDAGAEVGPAMT